MTERRKKQILKAIALCLALFTVVNSTVEISAHFEEGREIYTVSETELLENEQVEDAVTPEQVDSGLPMYYEGSDASGSTEGAEPENNGDEQEPVTEEPEEIPSDIPEEDAETAMIPTEDLTQTPTASPTPIADKENEEEAQLTVDTASFGAGQVSVSLENVVLSEDAVLTFGSSDVSESAFIDGMKAAGYGGVLAIKTMDISLLGENGKVSLEDGQIKITLNFNTPLFTEIGDVTNTYYQVVHMTGSGVEVLASQSATSAGLSSITFVTSSFSPYAIVAVGSEDGTAPTSSPEASPLASPEASPSVSPSASPDENEEETDSFTFYENGIHASATLNGGETLPADVKLRVDPSGFGGKDGGALSAVESYLTAQGQKFMDGGVFDVYFWDWNNNKAVDPKQGAYVTVNFDRGVYVGGAQTAVRLFQVIGGSVTELGGSVSRNGDGSVNGISLNLNNFDLVVIAGVSAEDGESDLIETEYTEQQLTEQSIAVHASDDAWIYVKGLLPEGATVTAIPVSMQVSGEKVLAAYDITIWDAEGKEYTITDAVTVSITTPALKDTSTGVVSVYHKEDQNAEAEKVAETEVNYNKVSFEAKSFSLYIITTEDGSRQDIDFQTYNLAEVATIYVSVETNNTPIQSGTAYPINSTFKLVLEYEISNAVVNELRDSIPEDAEGTFDFYYQMPANTVNAMPFDSGNIIDPATKLSCGTYTIDSSGKVLFQFKKDFIKKGSDIGGTFTYWFTINEDEYVDKEEISLEFPGIMNPVKIQLATADTTGWKSNGDYNAETNTIPFTINLNVGAFCDELVITDVPGENLIIDDSTITVEKIVNGILQTGNYTVEPDENGGFKITLTDVPKGAIVKVTYDASVDNLDKVGSDGKVTGLENTVSWTANGETNSNTTYPSVSKVNTGSKYGYASGQVAKWVVDINNGSLRADVSGKVYTDTLGEGQQYVKESLKIYEDGVDVTDAFTGSISWTGESSFTITLPAGENGANNKAYKFTYDTIPTEKLEIGGNITLINKGRFDNGEEFGGKVTIERKDETSVSKVALKVDKYGVADWKIVITPDKLAALSEITFEDFIGYIDNDTRNWSGSVFIEDSVDITGDYVPKWTKKFKNSVKPNDGLGYDTMQITFDLEGKTVETPITITYQTQNVSEEASNGIIIDNICWMNGQSACGKIWYQDYVSESSGIFKGYYNGIDADNTINWWILANGENEWGQGEAPHDFQGKTMIITDTLPDGMEYADWYECFVNNDRTRTESSISVSEDKKTITVTVPNVYKEPVYVQIKAKVTNLQYDHTYTNQASYGYEGKAPLGYAEASVEKKSNILEKQGTTVTVDNETQIEYTITVNKDGVNYLPGENDYLILEDTIPENVELVNGSITFTDAGGSAVTDATYLYNTATRLLTVQVPDGKKVDVKYRVKPNLIGLSGGPTYQVTVNNTVMLRGNANTSAGGSKTFTVVGSNATAGSTTHILTLQKRDAQDTGRPLEGAVFEVVKITFNEDGTATEESLGSQTTGADGNVVYSEGINSDTVYYYQEKKAPDGYMLDGTKHYLIYKGKNDNDYQKVVNAFKEHYPNEKLNESANEDILITNMQNPEAVIEATKNLSGRELQAGDFAFQLTEVDSTGEILEGGILSEKKNEADGKVSFKFRYTAEGTHYYILEEIEPGNESKKDWQKDVTYDKNKYLVTVELTYSPLANIYIPQVSYAKLGDGEVSTAVFNNTYEPTISKTVTKVWAGNETEHPQVTMQLKKNASSDGAGGTVVREITLPTEAGEWTYTWENLPLKDEAGNDITYRIEEVVPEGYTSSTSISGDTTTITNTKLTSISGKKTWEDDGDRDGIRPKEITVALMAGKVQQMTTTASAPDWTYSFDNLSMYEQNGNAYDYWVKETKVPDGYEATEGRKSDNGAYDITNTHTPETTSVSVTKEWKDENNQDGLRQPVTVYLLANGSRVKAKDSDGNDTEQDMSLVLSEGNWSGSFTNLPKKNNGQAIEYKVEELKIDGYDVAISENNASDGTFAYTITNIHKPGTVRIVVNKQWVDGDNRDGKRPDEITVKLTANVPGVDEQQKVIHPVTEDGVETWSCSFEDLAKYYTDENGKTTEIEYEISEVVPDGYTPEYTKSSSYDEETKTDTYTWSIINTYNPEVTSLAVTKVWEDGSNQDGLRPDSINVQLYADGKPYGEFVTLTGDGDSWSHMWDNLPKNKNTASGVSAIKYTVDEIAYTKDGVTNNVTTGNKPFAGYEKVISYEEDENKATITNTHTPETLEIPVTKVWDDDSDRDGVRPDVTINLYGKISGVTVETRSVILKKAEQSGDSWSYTFEKLPKFHKGQEITYSVEEEALDTALGYTSKIEPAGNNGFTITNSRDIETVVIEGEKTWKDEGNKDKRPGSITIQLYADNELVEKERKTVEPDENGNWSWKFTDLPKYAKGAVGQKITYTVKEDPVTDYSTAYSENGLNVINTYTPGYTNKTVTKEWADKNNQDGKRPESIQVQLLADDKTYGNPVTIKGDSKTDKWTYTWENLPIADANGKTIVYTVQELGTSNEAAKMEGYDTTYDQETLTITNTHTPESTNVKVTKIWDDANNQDGKRFNVTLNLVGKIAGEGSIEKTVVEKTVTLEIADNQNSGDKWVYTFTGLEKYAEGKLINYTVDEVLPEDSGYEKEVTGTAEGGYTITNTHEVITIPVSGSKTWVDTGNVDKRPENGITVHLMKQTTGEKKEVTSQTVMPDADGNWSWDFGTLPKYENGAEITYTVTEDAVSDYTRTDDGKGLNITNQYTPGTTSITVVKDWVDNSDQDGKRSESITVQLMQDTGSGSVPYTKDEANEGKQVLSASNEWKYTWTGLPSATDTGATIVYSVKEIDKVEGYTTKYEESGTTITITNTHTLEILDIPVTKVWDDDSDRDGVRPNVTINLYGKIGEETVETRSVTLEKAGRNEDSWSYTFENLPKFHKGQEITYSVEEADLDKALGYNKTNDNKPVITGNMVDGFNITNTREPEVTTVSGTKTWVDKGTETRPKSITIRLYAGNEPVEEKVQTVEPDKNGNWSWSFTNLPVYADGQKITYTVKEDPVTDYSTTYSENGLNVTNTYTPGYTSKTVTKEWKDDQNREALRPASIQVQLLADGEPYGAPVTITGDSKADTWTYTWTDLPVKKDGKEITYTVKEISEVPHYTTSYSEDTFTITNTHSTETVSIRGEKTWVNTDAENLPESITINLLADGVKVDSKELKEALWKWEFKDKPKYKNDNGVKTAIIYTIEEEPVANYTTVVDGFNVTNTYKWTEVTVEKVWEDGGNADESKTYPEITVQLLANGQPIGEGDTIQLSETAGWNYTWSKLPYMDDAGMQIQYTVNELNVPEGYEVSYSPLKGKVITITNKRTPVATATPTATSTPDTSPTATPDASPTATPETSATPDTTPTATPQASTTPVPTTTPGTEPTATPNTEPTATPGTEETPAPTPETVVEPTPTGGPVVTPEATPTPTGVLSGTRVKAGKLEAAVLGARRGREAAVLGARRRPSTGDSIAILIWMLVLGLSIGTATASGIMMKSKKR